MLAIALFLGLSSVVIIGLLFQLYLFIASRKIYHIETGKPIESASLIKVISKLILIIKKQTSYKDMAINLLDNGQPFIMADYFPAQGFKINVFHPEDLKKVLSGPDFDKLEFSSRMSGQIKAVFGKSMIFATGKDGWHQRKSLNPAFTYGKIKLLTPSFVDTANRFLDYIDKHQIVDIHAWFKNYAFDSLGITMFGYDFQSMTKNNIQNSNLHTTFDNIIRPLDVMTLGLYNKLPLAHNKQIKDARDSSKKLLYDVINKRIEERSKNIINSNDLLDLILDSYGDNLSTSLIVHNLFLFFFAGHDTTANTITAAVYYLGKYPEYQEKVFEEVKSILGKDGCPTFDNIGEFKYINAILKETLRLNPPILQGVPRVAIKDTELHGYFIPKGTVVEANFTHAHYKDEFFPEARTFNPNRFLDPNANLEAKQIFSFSTGPRICIGHKFAMLEMTITLAMMSRRFKWNNTKEWINEPGNLTLSPKDGLPINLEKRT